MIPSSASLKCRFSQLYCQMSWLLLTKAYHHHLPSSSSLKSSSMSFTLLCSTSVSQSVAQVKCCFCQRYRQMSWLLLTKAYHHRLSSSSSLKSSSMSFTLLYSKSVSQSVAQVKCCFCQLNCQMSWLLLTKAYHHHLSSSSSKSSSMSFTLLCSRSVSQSVAQVKCCFSQLYCQMSWLLPTKAYHHRLSSSSSSSKSSSMSFTLPCSRSVSQSVAQVKCCFCQLNCQMSWLLLTKAYHHHLSSSSLKSSSMSFTLLCSKSVSQSVAQVKCCFCQLNCQMSWLLLTKAYHHRLSSSSSSLKSSSMSFTLPCSKSVSLSVAPVKCCFCQLNCQMSWLLLTKAYHHQLPSSSSKSSSMSSTLLCSKSVSQSVAQVKCCFCQIYCQMSWLLLKKAYPHHLPSSSSSSSKSW